MDRRRLLSGQTQQRGVRSPPVLAGPDSKMVSNMVRASDELAKAATSLRSLTAQDSPTVKNMNATLKEISRTADALRLLAETIEQQPAALYRGKRQKSTP